MLDHISPENLLFLDIETVPAHRDYKQLPDKSRELWDKKAAFIKKEDQNEEEVYERAGIYAEFGRIICISAGFVFKSGEEYSARIKSFSGEDEIKILNQFKDLLENFSKKRDFTLCAHNGKEFDFPYIARRMLINEIPLPDILDIAGKKPWEVRFADTMELWKFGDFKNYTSLELLSSVLGIPTPKDDIDGSMVGKVYYEEQDLPRIVKYCEKDVITIIKVLFRLKGLTPPPDTAIEIVE